MESWIPQSSRELWRERALLEKRDALANAKLVLYRAFGFDIPLHILQEEAEKELTWNPRSALSTTGTARPYYTDPLEEVASAKIAFEKRLRAQRAVLKRYPEKAEEYSESLLETLEYASEERLLPFYVYAFPEERVSQHQRRFVTMREELVNGTFPYQDELRGLRLISVIDGSSDMVLFVLADITRIASMLSDTDHWILSNVSDVPDGAPKDARSIAALIQKQFRDSVLFMSIPHLWGHSVAYLKAEEAKEDAHLTDFVVTFNPRKGTEYSEQDLASLNRHDDPRALVLQIVMSLGLEDSFEDLPDVGDWYMPWAVGELKKRLKEDQDEDAFNQASKLDFYQARLKNRCVRYLFDIKKSWVSRDSINESPVYSLRIKDYRKDENTRGGDIDEMLSNLEKALYGINDSVIAHFLAAEEVIDGTTLAGASQTFLINANSLKEARDADRKEK